MLPQKLVTLGSNLQRLLSVVGRVAEAISSVFQYVPIKRLDVSGYNAATLSFAASSVTLASVALGTVFVGDKIFVDGFLAAAYSSSVTQAQLRVRPVGSATVSYLNSRTILSESVPAYSGVLPGPVTILKEMHGVFTVTAQGSLAVNLVGLASAGSASIASTNAQIQAMVFKLTTSA